MKIKFSGEVLGIALAALLALPLQQVLLKHKVRSVKEVLKSFFILEENWSECALTGNAQGVVLMANSCFKKNRYAAGEAWLKFGTYQLQSPSVMLFYGDWLRQRGNERRAVYLYNFALKKARREKAPENFICTLEQRLRSRKK